MGQYEPHDSRDVTQSAATAPGEPKRTGPREDAARREAQEREEDEREPADRGELAIDNPAGDARPEYDQYAITDPLSIDKRDSENVEEADSRIPGES